ncbi:MAG: sulfatase-modifying factor protein, partial [Bacteroidetes bacterium]|nr:sulfatase-modifying factor protein [Bacteroidota bacterium]
MPHLLRRCVLLLVVAALCLPAAGRSRHSRLLVIRTSPGLSVEALLAEGGSRIPLPTRLPLFSLEADDSLVTSLAADAWPSRDSVTFTIAGKVTGSFRMDSLESRSWSALLTIRNGGAVTMKIANVVPFGQGRDRVYITATGPPSLSRSALFRPGVGPLGVLLPDNAWEMGFCDVPLPGRGGLTAIARRIEVSKAERRRFSTLIEPGGSVTYRLHAEIHAGDYHDGLRLMFQERWLYDLEEFDNTLFERNDLAWIRKSYLITLLFAWDREYIDRFPAPPGSAGTSGFDAVLAKRRKLLGNYDVLLV